MEYLYAFDDNSVYRVVSRDMETIKAEKVHDEPHMFGRSFPIAFDNHYRYVPDWITKHLLGQTRERVISILEWMDFKSITESEPTPRIMSGLLAGEPLCRRCHHLYAYDTSLHEDYCDDCYTKLRSEQHEKAKQ